MNRTTLSSRDTLPVRGQASVFKSALSQQPCHGSQISLVLTITRLGESTPGEAISEAFPNLKGFCLGNLGHLLTSPVHIHRQLRG